MKIKRRVFTLALISACAFLLALMFALGGGKSVKALNLSANLFDVRGMSVQEQYKTDGTSSYSDTRSGLRLSGDEGAKAILNSSVSGKFNLEFMPESGLKELEIAFTNTSDGGSFSVVVEFGVYDLNAYAKSDGKKAGLYYTDYGLCEASAVYNASGDYTIVENDYSAINVVFDPSSMNVYVNEKLIWCLRSAINDQKDAGFAFDFFNEYEVAVSFLKTDGTASGVVYEINGQPIDGILLVAKAAPRLYADSTHDAVVNRLFKLPQAYAYDVIDGRLKDSDCKIKFVSGPKTLKILDGGYVYPETAGYYRFEYSVKNSAGIEGTLSYYLCVDENYKGEYSFVGEEIPTEIGLYTSLVLPSATYESSQIFSEKALSVDCEIYREGKLVASYENVSENFVYNVNETGKYTVIYKPKHDYFSGDEKIFEFSATDSIAGYELKSELKKQYVQGTMFEIPEATIKTTSGNAEAGCVVKCPDGSVYYGEKTKAFLLKFAGDYVIEYSATIGDKTYRIEKEFTVLVDAAQLFTYSGLTSVKQGGYDWNAQYTGLSIDLAKDTKLIYNNVIDLSSYDYSADKSSALLIKGLVNPKNAFINDIAYLRIVLTDVENSDNYVEICLSNWDEGTNDYRSVIRVSVSGGREVGLYWSGGVSQTHFDRLGYVYNSSLSAKPYEQFGGIKPFELYFDYENYQIRSALLNPASSEEYSLVADLSSVEQIGSVWEGFSSDKAILSLYATGMKGSSAKILLMNVDGNDFTDGAFKDDVAPSVSVSAPDVAITGVVGVPYPLPIAAAYDSVDGIVAVRRELYYVGNGGELFNIGTDGNAFIPKLAGNYVVRYTATDNAGNERIEEYDIIVKNEKYYEENPLRVVLSSGYDKNGKTGLLCTVAEVESCSGGSGELSVERSVFDSSGNVVAVEDNTFYPQTAGTYTVRFAVTDALGTTKNFDYQINVIQNTDVVFYNDGITMPKAFLRNTSYALPIISVADYTGESVVSSETKAVIVNSETQQIVAETDANGKVTINTDCDKVTVRYICSSNTSKYLDYSDIPVQNTVKKDGENEVLDLAGWFYSDGEYGVSLSEKNLTLTTNQNGTRIYFLRGVAADNLEMRMDVDSSTASAFKSFSIYLVDSQNEKIAVKLKISKNEDGAKISVNDGNSVDMVGSFTGKSNYSLSVNYSATGYVITDNAKNTTATVDYTMYGEEFKGFTSGVVNVSFEFECSGNVGLCIEKINNQLFNDSVTEDTTAPVIVSEKSIGGSYKVGDIVKIPHFVVADVLFYSESFVTVKTPSGDFAKATNGTLLSHCAYKKGLEFELSESGNYVIYLFGKDENGIEGNTSVTVRCIDDVAPTITVDGMPESINLGETLTLPTATVSDNADTAKKLSVYVYIIKANGVADCLTKYEYTPAEKGTYIVRYLVRDTSYNYSYVDFNLVVK